MFIFFHEKILSVKKASNAKQAIFTPLEDCAHKIVAFVVFCSLVFVLLVGFLFVSVFVCAESFRKKKINRFEIISVTSITILLSIIIRLDIRKFLCMVYNTITRIRKSTWVVSYWANFNFGELYWINSKLNKWWVCFRVTICKKKLSSIKFGYSAHKGLEKQKKTL